MEQWKRLKQKKAEKEKYEPFYIEEKFKEYIYYIDPMLDKFPKSERFGLYKKIKELNYDLISDIIIYGKKPKEVRTNGLRKVDNRLQALKFFIRYAYDCPKHCICGKTYEVASGMLNEIGLLLGGVVNPETVKD